MIRVVWIEPLHRSMRLLARKLIGRVMYGFCIVAHTHLRNKHWIQRDETNRLGRIRGRVSSDGEWNFNSKNSIHSAISTKLHELRFFRLLLIPELLSHGNNVCSNQLPKKKKILPWKCWMSSVVTGITLPTLGAILMSWLDRQDCQLLQESFYHLGEKQNATNKSSSFKCLSDVMPK